MKKHDNEQERYESLIKKYKLNPLPREFTKFKIYFPKEQYELDDDLFPLEVCFLLEGEMDRKCEFFMNPYGEDKKLAIDEVETILDVVNSNNEGQNIKRLRKGLWALMNARAKLENGCNVSYLCNVINKEFKFYKGTILPLVETVTSKLKTLPNSKKRPVSYIS